jgi:multiple sugar transport system permease protein/putative aldouronate transport system permease protein
MMMAKTGKRSIKPSVGDRTFYAVNNLCLGVVLIIVLYPLLYIVACSFSSSRAVVSGRVFLWPVEPTLIGYSTIFENPQIVNSFFNSVFYTVTGTAISLFFTLTGAYPLSRKDFKLRGVLMALFAFTLFFGGGLIPTYMLINNLGIINTRLAMVLPTALSVYNMVVTRTFFQNSIPNELLDASQVDGCSDLRFFASVVLPLSGAIIAVMALFYGVSIWNSYFNAMIYLNDEHLAPLQIILRKILVQNRVDISMMASNPSAAADISAKQSLSELLKYSLIVISSLPMLCLYPFIQRYFVKGVMIGALKG